MKRSGRRTSDVVVDMTKFGLDPVPTDKIGRHREALAMERPKAGTIAWQREAGSFDVGWGLPDFGVFCRTDTGRAKDPWRRGIDVVDDSSTGQGLETSPLLAFIYLNWLEARLMSVVRFGTPGCACEAPRVRWLERRVNCRFVAWSAPLWPRGVLYPCRATSQVSL